MTRLPVPGSDIGTWGNVLNDYLSVEHNIDGTLKKAPDIANALATANAKYTKPSTGIPETDLSSSVVTKLNTVSGGTSSPTANTAMYINVQNYGAVGDGSTDNTAAIQAAITAAGGRGIVFFPAAANHYKFSTITVPTGVYLKGAGWKCDAQDPFGSTNYTTSGSRPSGSVLRSTATTGAAITFTGTSRYQMADLCVVGPGTGSSTGVLLGTGVYNVQNMMADVLVCNFSTCWDLSTGEDGTYLNIRARGCHIGISSGEAFNQNVIINCEVQFSDTYGILTNAGSQNQWVGGLLQNTSGTASLRHVSGELSTYSGFYHESSTPPTNMILVSAGSQCVFRDWWFSAPAGQITVAGGGLTKFDNIRSAAMVNFVASGGSGIMYDVQQYTLTGAWAPNWRIWDDNVGLSLGASNRLTIKTGVAGSGSRPSASTMGKGAQFFDSTLNKPIWSDGSVWRDANGTAV